MAKNTSYFECPICDLRKEEVEGRTFGSIDEKVKKTILEEHPEMKDSDLLCNACVSQIHLEYLHESFDRGELKLSPADRKILRDIGKQGLLTPAIRKRGFQPTAFPDRLADRIAAFGGSWRFILIFVGLLIAWVSVNTFLLLTKPVDPFPFVLLNLALSCIAALQAPVIMMSQNRQEEKDRLRSQNDYLINLKAELEIRYISYQVDQLAKRNASQFRGPKPRPRPMVNKSSANGSNNHRKRQSTEM